MIGLEHYHKTLKNFENFLKIIKTKGDDGVDQKLKKLFEKANSIHDDLSARFNDDDEKEPLIEVLDNKTEVTIDIEKFWENSEKIECETQIKNEKIEINIIPKREKNRIIEFKLARKIKNYEYQGRVAIKKDSVIQDFGEFKLPVAENSNLDFFKIKFKDLENDGLITYDEERRRIELYTQKFSINPRVIIVITITCCSKTKSNFEAEEEKLFLKLEADFNKVDKIFRKLQNIIDPTTKNIAKL